MALISREEREYREAIYKALTHDELVARCLAKDAAIAIAADQLDQARARIRTLEHLVNVGRAGL